MRTRRARRARAALLVVGAVLMVSGGVLLQTALFHLNPIKIGYRRSDYSECVIYSKESSVEEEYQELRAAMRQNESALELHYKARIKLILCASQRDVDRYLPLVNRRDRNKAGSFAPWPNTIYVTPKIKEKYGDLRGALAHELSHLLLLQNYGVVRCTRLWRKQEWIPEGYAVFCARWPMYFKRERLRDAMSNAGIDMNNGLLLGNKRVKEIPLPTRFMIYYYFIEYLHEQDEEFQLLDFLKRACGKPGDVGSLFEESFGRSLADYVKEFKASLSGQ